MNKFNRYSEFRRAEMRVQAERRRIADRKIDTIIVIFCACVLAGYVVATFAGWPV